MFGAGCPRRHLERFLAFLVDRRGPTLTLPGSQQSVKLQVALSLGHLHIMRSIRNRLKYGTAVQEWPFIEIGATEPLGKFENRGVPRAIPGFGKAQALKVDPSRSSFPQPPAPPVPLLSDLD